MSKSLDIKCLEIMVFSREHNGRTYYSGGISKKDKRSNEWANGYVPLVFRKGVEIPNKTKISLEGFITFYRKGYDTITQIFVTDYKVLT